MRTKAPKLILQGDTRRAKPWIPWAEKWLKRLKNALGDIPINQCNWVVGGDRAVFVHVRSVVGIDRIRIFVKQPKEEGCLDSAAFTFTTTGLTVFLTPDPILCRAGTFWDFGDNQYKRGTLGQGTISHTYERAGTYSVKLISYTVDTVDSLPDLEVTNNGTTDMWKSSSFGFSWAACHANYITKTFSTSAISGGSEYYGKKTGAFYNIFEQKDSYLLPLLTWDGEAALATGRVIAYLTGAFTSYIAYDDDGASKPIGDTISGSNLGTTAFELATDPVGTNIATLIDHTQPMVDTVITLQDQSATDPSAQLPDPATMADQPDSNKYSGWNARALNSNPLERGVHAIVYESKKEQTNIVTVA